MTLWTIAGILLAVWAVIFILHIVIHLLGWLISMAPLIALILIIAGLFASRKSRI